MHIFVLSFILTEYFVSVDTQICKMLLTIIK